MNGVPFLKAGPLQCRRPLWPKAERIGNVCGQPVHPRKSYCPDCMKRLFEQPTPTDKESK